MIMALQHVPGKKKVDIKIYALSTCPWCKKAKQLLDSQGVDYYFTDVDMLTGDERNQAMDVVKKWNPSASFPTIVINDNRCIVGFREDEIKEAIK
jgi:glutaredoxin-like protein NrdH